MRVIAVSALVAFMFCVAVMIVGRAVDQVHRDACTIEWSTDTGTANQGRLCYNDTP